ncbi:MAG: efflux transporter outer membrane subunit [Sphingomonadales bacterium]|nr:efflux transporter outer membrane subunit [Sphingomonadales bacterium]MDE2170654.1 efflux transporter outer membrane subunit [Sphingomonadales bacterium]
MMRPPCVIALACALASQAAWAKPVNTGGTLPIPTQFPTGPAYPSLTNQAPSYSYRDALADPRLLTLIDQGLTHNQDIAAALANIEASQAQFHIARAALFPEFDASAGWVHSGGDRGLGVSSSAKGDAFNAQGIVSSYELDLFGRLRDLSDQARASYLGTQAAAQATRLTLVASIATGWLTYGADTSLLQLARDTAKSAQASVELTRKRVDGGIAPLADLRKAEITLRQAQADIANQTALQAQDVNALRLLVGADISPATLPTSLADASGHLSTIPAGLSSDILLRRPDVMQAEDALAAAQANAAAARAALFPRITLTGLLGTASTALANLFTGGTFAWAGGSTISYPIFRAGAAKATARQAEAQQRASLAAYRKSVQAAFSDVANVLARRGTIADQLAASTAARDAARENYDLTSQRYRGGINPYLDVLSAEQTLYSSEKTLIATVLADGVNRVSLYRALGGDRLDGPGLPRPVRDGG